MATYRYEAMDCSGKHHKGEKDGFSEQDVASMLKESGMFPTLIKEKKKPEDLLPHDKMSEHELKNADPVSPWHWYFAWKPIETWDQRQVWLKWVHRRLIKQKCVNGDIGNNITKFEYHYPENYV